MKRWLIKSIAVWLGVLVTFGVAVYPDPVLDILALDPQKEQLIRLFTGLNAILLVFLSSVGIKSARWSDPGLSDTDHKNLLPQAYLGHRAPFRSIIIFGNYSADLKGLEVTRFFRKTAILANLKPVVVHSIREMESELDSAAAMGVIAQAVFYEDLIPSVKRSGKTLFNVHREPSNRSAGVGLRIDFGFDFETFDNESLFFFSNTLSQVFAQDTPRGVGFHGNWVGTYGLISLHQNEDLSVDGWYWYGKGQIEGSCTVDEKNERVILSFDWSQTNNDSDIASRNIGKGVFLLPAGYEFFTGYWEIKAEPDTAQIWCGVRLSSDICMDIKRGGEYKEDFGLSQHSLENLVTW